MIAGKTSQRLLAALLAGIFAAPAFAAAPDPAKTVTVDCARGDSVARAIAASDERKPLVVVVNGTCTESVVIARGDVTLLAASAGAGITGPEAAVDAVAVLGSRTLIDGLTISGGRNGIAGSAAPALVIRGVTVGATGRTGIVFATGTSGRIENSTILHNARDGISVDASSVVILASTITANNRIGIVVTNNGAARIGLDEDNVPGGTSVTQNGASGISATLGGSVYLASSEVSGNGTDVNSIAGRYGLAASGATATLIGGNTIANNAATGVNATRSGSIVVGDTSFGLPTLNTIRGNGTAGSSGGVFAFMGSALQIRDAVITGNAGFGLGLSLKSQAQLMSSTLSGNGDGIRLVFGSGLFLAQPSSTVSDNSGYGVQCTDAESSLVNTAFLVFSGNALGTVAPTCTGF